MKPIFIDWVWEGLLIIVLVYVSAIVLQSALAWIVRKKVPLQLGVVAAGAMYTAITWTFYYNHATPLSLVFPWFGLVILGGMGLKLAIYVQGRKDILNAKPIVDFLKPVIEFSVLFIIFAALYAVLVADRRLPVVITGNGDIWSYAKFSHLALNQPMGNNILNLDLLKTSAADQTPTAFMFLAGLAYCSRQAIVDVLGLGLILILTISVIIVKKLCVKYWPMQASLAYLIAVAWVTSSFSFYLATNYFFAQWLGICLFLATILMALSNKETILIQTAILSLLNYVMFMTYPPLFFPYMGVLLFLVAMEAVFSGRRSGGVFFNPGLVSAIFSIPVSLGIAVVLDFGHFKIMMSRIAELSRGNGGWPLNLLNPVVLMMAPVKPLDTGVMIGKIIGYVIILALVCFLMYRAYKTKTHSSARFAVNIVFIAGLLTYFCYYALKGASYQAWKFAGSVVFPLSFLPMAAVVSAFDRHGRVGIIVKHVLLILLIGANAFFINKFAIRNAHHLRMLASLRALTYYDQDPNVKTVHVNIKGDSVDTMMAMQFINQKPLALDSLSYFSKDTTEDYSKLSRDNILVTNNCAVFNGKDLTMLGDSFCIVTGVPLGGM